MLRVLTPVIITTLLLACAEESPFMSKEEAHRLVDDINTSRDPFHAVKNVVAIINNDIYYFSRLDTIPRKLTSSPGHKKTHVKLSSERTKVAYLDGNGNPVIIRASDGQLIETLEQFSNITQMDWVRSSATLFMLIGQEVVLHGPTLSFVQPETYTPWDEVLSFSMNAMGDQGYFIARYNEYGNKFEYHSSAKNLAEQYSGFEGEVYNYIDFYDDAGNFLLGFKNPFEDGIERIVCVENYNFYSAYEWDDEHMQTPEFNTEHEILLYGAPEGEKYYLKGVYLGIEAYGNGGPYDRLTMKLANYSSDTPVYIDWVQ